MGLMTKNSQKKSQSASDLTTKRKPVKRQRPEYLIQRDIVNWFRKEYPDFLLFSCPNEAIYRRREYFHQLGALSGVSDLVIVTDKRVLWVECKSDTGRQSTEQRQFQSNVERLGYKYYLVRSLSQFKEIISNEFN